MTDEAREPGERCSASDARCRSLAGRVLAALSDHSGFVAIIGVPPHHRERLLAVLRDLAAAEFELIEVSRRASPDLAGLGGMTSGPGAPAVTTAGEAAAVPPLFVIDDAERQSAAETRALCEAAPFSRDWAALLSLRIVLITRLGLSELDFLQERITACFNLDQFGHGEIGPAVRSCERNGAAGAEAARDEAAPRGRRGAGLRQAGSIAAQGSAVSGAVRPDAPRPKASPAGRIGPPPQAARRPLPRHDLRPYAMFGYVAVVGMLTACYLLLQIGGGPQDPIAPAGSRAAAEGGEGLAARHLLAPGDGDAQATDRRSTKPAAGAAPAANH